MEAAGTEGLCCLCRVAAAAALACYSPVTLAALPTASMLGLFLSIAACCIPHLSLRCHWYLTSIADVLFCGLGTIQ
mgnify:CR=1 FL=1